MSRTEQRNEVKKKSEGGGGVSPVLTTCHSLLSSPAHRERKEKYLTDLEQRVKDFEKAAALNANTDEQMRLIQENRELKELVVSLESELKTAKFDFEFPIAVNDTPPSSSSIHSGGGGIDVGTPLTDPSTSNFEEEMKSSGNFFSLFPPLEQQQPQLQLQQLQTSLPPSLPPATSSAVGVDAVLASLSGPAPFLMSSLNAFDQQQQQQQQFDLFFQQHQQMQQQHQQQQIDFSSTTFQSYREDMALISPTTTHPLLLPPQPVLSPQDELKLIIESLAASSSSSTASSSTTASIIPASIDPTTSGTDGTVPCSEWKTNLKKMVPSVDDCNIDSLCASFEAKVRCEVVQKKLLNAITAGDTLQTLEIVRVINEKMNERRMMNEVNW